MTTFARYLALQVPAWGIALTVAWGLDAWSILPRLWIGIGLTLFVTMDLVLYPFVRSAYEHLPHDAGQSLVGRKARVLVALDPTGWVQIGSERWRASTEDEAAPIPVGAEVLVTALRGYVVLVRDGGEAREVEGGC